MDLADLRLSYAKAGLLEADAQTDPIEQFRIWFSQALAASIPEVNAMALATADRSGRPDVRTVLLKGFDESGFVFYTNYQSRKAAELESNPSASLLFFWSVLERQIRIAGTVSKTSESESDAYFQSRPRGHQLGAWASAQSQVVTGRDELEAQLAEVEARFENETIPRPRHWGGYRLSPEVVEFWQGRPNRLHDRLRYEKSETGWIRNRLSP